DTSAQKASSLVRVVLEFQLHPNTSPEKTLLRYAQSYEEALKVRPLSTLASNGVVRFVVEYKNGIRSEYFQGYRSGALRLASDNDTHRKMLNQFRSTVRFVYIKSGENVQSLLSGRFRDILNLVLRDHLHAQYKSAEAMRDSYRTGLASDLLNPLQEKALKVVSKIFPDIEQADLIPMIPTLDSTLADMQIRLRDKADTGLDSKGTGIRGGVLLALLQYLVEQSKRSLVLAVEEPESFLHPGAQEDLRDGLEDLVERRAVTLLVTTHSSFIVSRREGSKVIVLAKDDEGQTFIRGSSEGDDPNVSLSSELFRDQSVGDMLERVATAGIGDAEGFL
ncbi:ATP-dependent nuclease, partial [Bacillus cereus]|uniref:ATP-dependent nuclease n=1 Tax=Bacillus cereus TaxID=1396 RepID=UPI0036504F1E